MVDFANDWRTLVSRQEIGSGGVHPTQQQAAQLAYAEATPAIQAQLQAGKLGLRKEGLTNQQDIYQGKESLEGDRLALKAAWEQAMYGASGLKQAGIAQDVAQTQTMGGLKMQGLDIESGLQTEKFGHQQGLYGLTQQALDDKKLANTVAGMIQLPVAGMSTYALATGQGGNSSLVDRMFKTMKSVGGGTGK